MNLTYILKKNKKFNLSYFIKSHLFLSILGSFIGVSSTAIFFILIPIFLDQIFLAKFSLGILFFFGLLQLSLIGLDQNIIAHSQNLSSKKVIFDNKLLLLIISIIICIFFFFVIFQLKKIFIIELYFDDFIILNVAVIFGLICRVLQAYLQASSKLLENAKANLSRYLGYVLYLIYWVSNTEINILHFFLFGELIALFYLVFIIFFSIGFKYSVTTKRLNIKYLILGFSQFTYESLFKLDLLTISIFGTQKLLIMYTILSNILEGIINFISVAHPMIHNFMNKFKIDKVAPKDLKLIGYINHISILVLLMLLPTYMMFNYAVFYEFPEKNLIIIAFSFSIFLIFFRKVFLFFFFFSINNMPLNQFSFSFSMFISNLILNIILFKLIGIYGIVVATLLVYFFANIFINYYLKKYKSIINFL